MGLVTLVFMLLLSVIMLNNGWAKKPEGLSKIGANLKAYEQNIAFWGLIYGLVSLLATAMSTIDPVTMLVRLIASVMVIVMSLPYGTEKIMGMFKDKMKNPVLVEEIHDMVAKIKTMEKVLGFIGLGVSLLVFIRTFP